MTAKNIGMLLVGIWLEILENQCVFEATQHHLRYPELQYCEPLQARPDTGS